MVIIKTKSGAVYFTKEAKLSDGFYQFSYTSKSGKTFDVEIPRSEILELKRFHHESDMADCRTELELDYDR